MSCNKDSVSEPGVALPVIEENLSYNEAYRDSIVALKWDAVVIMYKDGTGLRKLTDFFVPSVTWSPNKWKILYSTGYELYVMNPDGGQRRLLSQQRELFAFAVASPDRHRIAYVAKDTQTSSGERLDQGDERGRNRCTATDAAATCTQSRHLDTGFPPGTLQRC